MRLLEPASTASSAAGLGHAPIVAVALVAGLGFGALLALVLESLAGRARGSGTLTSWRTSRRDERSRSRPLPEGRGGRAGLVAAGLATAVALGAVLAVRPSAVFALLALAVFVAAVVLDLPLAAWVSWSSWPS